MSFLFDLPLLTSQFLWMRDEVSVMVALSICNRLTQTAPLTIVLGVCWLETIGIQKNIEIFFFGSKNSNTFQSYTAKQNEKE